MKPNMMHSIYYLSAGSLPIRVGLTCSRSTAVDGTGPSQPRQSAGRRSTRSHNIQPLSDSSSCTHAPTFTSGPKRTGCCRKKIALQIELCRPFRSECKEWTKMSMHRWRSAEEALRQGCLRVRVLLKGECRLKEHQKVLEL